MNCSVRHQSFSGVAHKKYFESNQNCERTFFAQPYILDRRTISNTTRTVYYGKTRKENALLLQKINVLKEELEINFRKYQEEKSNLEQIVHHLNCQREGLTPLGSIITEDTHYSSRGMQAKSDCRQIKSIRRPLAPENTRDHGTRPSTQSSLQSLQESTIPREVKREILRRQSMRSKEKRQEQLQGDRQREMQLEDTVGVYTRINMLKGSLNYKGKPTNSSQEEGRLVNQHTPSSISQTYENQFSSSTSDTMTLSSQRSSVLSTRERKRYRKNFPHIKNHEVVPSQKPIAIKSFSCTTRRRNVNGAFVGPKGNNTSLRDRNRTTCHGVTLEKEGLETLSGNVVVTHHDPEINRNVVLGKASQEFAIVEKISEKSNREVHPKRNNFKIAKNAFETTDFSLAVSASGKKSRRFNQAVTKRVILPIRLQKQTRSSKRNDLEAHRERSYPVSESVLDENVTENKRMEQNEENIFPKTAKVSLLSAGKLQKLIREKVLSQSQTKSTKANPKTVVLADYLRTLQRHMGITESDVPESKSPDFSETPFIATATKFGSEDGQVEGPPTTIQRRLEMLQEQLVRLPSTFTLLDGDLVED